mgnify:FL=1
MKKIKKGHYSGIGLLLFVHSQARSNRRRQTSGIVPTQQNRPPDHHRSTGPPSIRGRAPPILIRYSRPKRSARQTIIFSYRHLLHRMIAKKNGRTRRPKSPPNFRENSAPHAGCIYQRRPLAATRGQCCTVAVLTPGKKRDQRDHRPAGQAKQRAISQTHRIRPALHRRRECQRPTRAEKRCGFSLPSRPGRA